MSSLEAWKIVGLQVWFVLAAASVVFSPIISIAISHFDEDGMPFIAWTGWCILWSLYFVLEGWPL